MMEFRDGFTPNWQENVGLPWNEYKLLERDKFEELVTMMIDAYPEHELTEWLKRGFCMNDGDSTISVGSLSGRQTLNWQYSHFDDEDADDYNRWFGEEEEVEFDDDW
jgi:hypothetical protein